MPLTKEVVLHIAKLGEIMATGRENGSITMNTYSENFKPHLSKFKDKYGTSPNLYLQNELKIFYDSNLKELSNNIEYKSFGYWGRSIYNYTWACIYHNFERDSIPASFSPQLYILINKDGIKFGFCYGNYIEENDEMVISALSGDKFLKLKKCFDDKDLLFLNSNEEEVTASPEKLFEKDERKIIKSDEDISTNWTNNSLLIKEFSKDNIPENISEIIQSTLLNLKDFFLSLLPIQNSEKSLIKNKMNKSEFDIILVKDQIQLSGLNFPEELISRFVSSLLTKPFVILTGLSGSGKTKLAQAFAKWICENKEQYCIVPVGADWTNREPLLGFPNALEKEKYVKPDNGVLDLIITAEENPDKPYFLILDEMNLSHVERYFADFLSVMESKDKICIHSGNDDWDGIPAEISFPQNLFIIGTVNIDETTYMFSPKVLDRANVIEFRVTAVEMDSFMKDNLKVNLEELKGLGAEMADSFVAIAKDNTLKTNDVVELIKVLMSFFNELKKTGAEFGYRTASEIMRFAAVVNKIEPDWKQEQIIDAAIMQKLLPKVHGSRRKLESVLKTLGGLCLKDKQKLDDLLKLKTEIDFTDPNILYSVSFEKIKRMYDNLISNGFTSYAEA
ncbi:MAG: hypothetical protein J0M18_17130 [Ignavibacteria bacterium]|nr:hypothetical protein [Ignavibacteria bacterium]